MSGITITPDSGTTFESGAAQYNSIDRLNDNTFVVAYSDNNDYAYGKVNVGTVSGTTISINENNAVTFNSQSTANIEVRSLSSSLFIISFKDVGDNNKPKVIAGTVSGTTVVLGSKVEVDSHSLSSEVTVAALDASNFVVSYSWYSSHYYVYAKVGSISGTTITLGSDQEISLIDGMYLKSVGLDGTHFVIIYGTDPAIGRVGEVNIIDKTISFGTPTNMSGANFALAVTAFDSSHFILVTHILYENYVGIVAGSINMDTLAITSGSRISVSNSYYYYGCSICAPDEHHFVISYNMNTPDGGAIRAGTLTGATTLTWDAQGEVAFDTDPTSYPAICRLTDNYFIIAFKEN